MKKKDLETGNQLDSRISLLKSLQGELTSKPIMVGDYPLTRFLPEKDLAAIRNTLRDRIRDLISEAEQEFDAL